jgi:hypothetical protein
MLEFCSDSETLYPLKPRECTVFYIIIYYILYYIILYIILLFVYLNIHPSIGLQSSDICIYIARGSFNLYIINCQSIFLSILLATCRYIYPSIYQSIKRNLKRTLLKCNTYHPSFYYYL